MRVSKLSGLLDSERWSRTVSRFDGIEWKHRRTTAAFLQRDCVGDRTRAYLLLAEPSMLRRFVGLAGQAECRLFCRTIKRKGGLLECNKDSGERSPCRAQLLSKHSTRLNASLGRWTQSCDRVDQISIILLFCRTAVPESNETEKYRSAWAQTTQALEAWISTNTDHFVSVRFDRSEENNGPYRTAERLISWALESGRIRNLLRGRRDLRSAMRWNRFERALIHPMFLRPNVVGNCRGIEVFDSHRHSPSDADVARALEGGTKLQFD